MVWMLEPNLDLTHLSMNMEFLLSLCLELAATKTYDPVFGTTSSAAHIAAVEIDPDTFEVRTEQFAVAEDCGKLVNPPIVDGQKWVS